MCLHFFLNSKTLHAMPVEYSIKIQCEPHFQIIIKFDQKEADRKAGGLNWHLQCTQNKSLSLKTCIMCVCFEAICSLWWKSYGTSYSNCSLWSLHLLSHEAFGFGSVGPVIYCTPYSDSRGNCFTLTWRSMRGSAVLYCYLWNAWIHRWRSTGTRFWIQLLQI